MKISWSVSENLSLITNYQQLREFITLEGTGEPRNTEFKNGNDWEHLKYKITRALLGLSNLEYGGKVILGIQENTADSNPFVGMTFEQSETYTLDKVKEFVNEYADPPLEIKLHKIDNGNGKYFVVINVLEFSELPTICKKDGGDGMLQRSKIYIRPKKKTETSDNFSHHDMRELLDLATEKHHKRQLKIHEKFKKLEETSKTKFDEEVSDF